MTAGIGTLIGRYVVVERIGEGASGVVHAAYDPLLDRKVALKLMRRQSEDDDERVRTMLAREAQAMARLAHPNVVAVHDVGAYSGGTFIAMEFVDGPTIRAWLGEKRRTDEILYVFLQAGRGLAAAHAVGLVHRDFKPANVLLGKDGRARVGDFGLARAPLATGDAGATLRMTIDTRTAPAGTPAYMAPEQRAGQAPDAKSDQYSYCVALYEALTGKLPQDGHAELPPGIRRVVSRGLSAPDARYGSMNELLDDLARATRPRWVPAAIVGAAVVALAVAVIAYHEGGKRHATALCHAGSERVGQVWNDGRRAELARAFVETRKPFANDALRATTAALDQYAQKWTSSYTDACEATHVRGEQSATLLDKRMACLERNRKELAAFVEQLARADGTTVTNAVRAVEELPPLAPCADAAALTRPEATPDPAIAAKVDDIQTRLAMVHGLWAIAHYKEALELSESVTKEASALGFGPLTANAYYTMGNVQGSLGDVASAEPTLRKALYYADSSAHDRMRAHVLVSLIHLLATVEARSGELATLRGDADAALVRAGGDERLRADLLRELATAKLTSGASAEAIPLLNEALRIIEETDGKEQRGSISPHYELGRLHVMLGHYEDAKREYEIALRIAEKVLGPSHDFVGTIYSGIGGIALDEERYADAEAAMRKSVTIERASVGDHPIIAYPLAILAQVLVASGRPAEAFAPAEEALAIYDSHGLSKHPGHFYVFRAIGTAHLARAENDAAVEALAHALDYRAHGPIDRADVEIALAKALVATKRSPARARELAASAAATYDKEAETPTELAERARIHAWLDAHGGARP